MESINRPELVKEHNLNLLRGELFKLRQATRQQLSAVTGISTVTLGGLLQELLEGGEAIEAEKTASKSGRPAQIYYYNPNHRYGLIHYISFENGRNMFHSAVLNIYGEAVYEHCQEAEYLGYSQTYSYFQNLLCLYEPVKAVGLGLPGIGFDEYLHSNDHKGFLSLKALKALEKEFDIPFLQENDVNLAAVGYAVKHDVPRNATMAYLYLMKGNYAGSAIYIDGRLHLGKSRFAGEQLPAPYGVDWPNAEIRDPVAVVNNLTKMVLPYITILAPHQMIVASDYVDKSHLKALEERLSSTLAPQFCPEIFQAEDFQQDYMEGARQLVLARIAPNLGGNLHDS